MKDLFGAVVSLVQNPNDDVTNRMLLRHNFMRGLQNEYIVCTEQPLFGNISLDWFIEYIEANIIFGAQRIMMHNMSMPSYLEPVVEHYKRKGIIEVLQWQFPAELDAFKETGMHVHLQQSMITDCQFRTQHWSQYLVLIDIDELIVPRHPDDVTWADMIKRSTCATNVNAYSARHLHFGVEHNTSEHHALVTMRRMQRNIKILPHGFRSKYIANTFLATELVTHSVDAGTGRRSCVLDPNIGGLHHYRSHNLGENILGSKYNVTHDDTMIKYGDRLKQAVNNTIKSTRKITRSM